MLSFFKRIFHIIIDAIVNAFRRIKETVLAFPPIRFMRWLINRISNSSRIKRLVNLCNRYSLILHIFLAMGINFTIEWLSRHSLNEAVLFLQNSTKVFIYNSYVIYVVLLLTYLTKKRTLVRCIVSFAFLVLGIINSIVLLNRVSPFGFTDLAMIGDLLTMQNTQYFSRAQGFLCVIALLVFILFMIYLGRKIKGEPYKIKLPIRAAIILVAFISIPIVTTTLQNTKVLAGYFGNLSQGYREYGFLYGFNMSAFSRGVKKPAVYDKESIAALIKESDMGASELNGENGPNIVVMLLESFFDPTEVEFIETNNDPIPFFRSLTENYSSGYLTVPVVGAGTCNSEFEVLTGMSCQFFGPGEYPQKTVLKDIDRCESVADVMKENGYSTHVVHNNGGNFYSRKDAFSLMGFDSFTSKEMLDITAWNPMGSWPMDDILIDATKDALDSTPQRDFVYTITVQTHGDYPTEPVIENPFIDVKCNSKTEEEKNRWSYYVNMVHQEDIFLKNYISMLEKRGEPTLVIMFGDHLPTMGLTNEEISTGDLFLTNYATWNNFDMEKEDADLTSFQLVSNYLDRLGIHGGNLVNYNQAMMKKGISPTSKKYLGGIQSLQYDILYGKGYAYEVGSDYYANDIEMGVKDIRIDRIYSFNNSLHLYGDNFTQWSKVYVGDEMVDTKYWSGQCLSISMDDVNTEDPIRVCQMGSGNTIFRESNKVYYREDIPE